jgi:hypothetical protein
MTVKFLVYVGGGDVISISKKLPLLKTSKKEI